MRVGYVTGTYKKYFPSNSPGAKVIQKYNRAIDDTFNSLKKTENQYNKTLFFE